MSFRSLATCPKVQGLYGQNVMRPVSAFRPKWLRCKKGDENETLRSLAGIGSFDIVGFGVVAFDGIVCAGRGGSLGAGRSAGAAGICAAHLPRSGLSLDAGLLGVERRRRLLLGPRHMGSGAGGHAVDAGLLGFLGWL